MIVNSWLIVFVQILLQQFLFDRLLSLFKCLKFEYWIQRLKKTSFSHLRLVCLWLVSKQIKGVINLNHSCGVGGKEPNRNYYQRKWYWYKYIILNSMCLSWNGSWHTCCEMIYLQRQIKPREGSMNTGTRGIIYCQPKWFLMHSLPTHLDVSKDLKRKQDFSFAKDWLREVLKIYGTLAHVPGKMLHTLFVWTRILHVWNGFEDSEGRKNYFEACQLMLD